MPTRLALLTLSAALPLLQAQQKSKLEIREIIATGCVRQAPQNHCLLLETLDGASTYTFLAAPQPELGTVITIQGKSHQGRGACKQGIPIDVTDWEPAGGRCVAPKPKATTRP